MIRKYFLFKIKVLFNANRIIEQLFLEPLSATTSTSALMMGAATLASSPDDHSDSEDHEHGSANQSFQSDKFDNDNTEQFVKDIEGDDNASDASNNKESFDLELDNNDDEHNDEYDSESYISLSRQNSEDDIELTRQPISADHPNIEEKDKVSEPNNCRLIINYKHHRKESPLCEMDPKVDVYIAKDGKLPINCLQVSYV